MMNSLGIVGIGAVACVAITPVVRTAAKRLHLVDRPDGHRKLHATATPLGGGIAVFLASLATLALLAVLPKWSDKFWEHASESWSLGLLAAATLLVGVGAIDDRFRLRGRHKLLGQLVACSVLLSTGFMISSISIFGWGIYLGYLSIPFSMFWLLGAINSLNLIDGVDGLASGVGVILSVTIGAMAMHNGHSMEAMVAFALGGALLGFLAFNLPPARMFLGDAGSMLIGLVLGSLAIRASLKGPATVALAAPMAVWAIPILDCLAAILRRKLTGRSLYATDRAHLHHWLLARLGSNYRVLLVVGVCCIVTSLGSLITVWWKSDLFAFLSGVAVIGVLVAGRLFGHVEAMLIASRVKHAGMQIVSPFRRSRTGGREAQIRLQGSREWHLLWETLTECAERFKLQTLHLDLNLPMLQEGFNASWRQHGFVQPEDLWRTEIPLLVGERSVGRLSISGEHDGLSVCELIERLMEVVRPFEERLVEMTHCEVAPPTPVARPHLASEASAAPAR